MKTLIKFYEAAVMDDDDVDHNKTYDKKYDNDHDGWKLDISTVTIDDGAYRINIQGLFKNDKGKSYIYRTHADKSDYKDGIISRSAAAAMLRKEFKDYRD